MIEAPDERYYPAIQDFIRTYGEVFYTIVGDRSVRFEPDRAFAYNHRLNKCLIGAQLWEWADDKPVSDWQRVWATCHELGHVADLIRDPEGYRGQFDYIETKAAELAPAILDVWRTKFGEPLPPHYSEPSIPTTADGTKKVSYAEYVARDRLHELYNVVDDLAVNAAVPLRAGIFAQGGSQEHAAHDLYRDILFPAPPPSAPDTAAGADYRDLPKSTQLLYALLRRKMVPDQPTIIADDVQAILAGFSDKAAKKIGIAFADEVYLITDPATEGSTIVSQRSARVREQIEPAFIKLLLDDLAHFEPPQSDQPDQQSQPNPWRNPNQLPRPIDRPVVERFIHEKIEKANKPPEENSEPNDNPGTIEERIRHEREQQDNALIDIYVTDAEKKEEMRKHAEEYRRLQEAVAPHSQALAAFFQSVIFTVEEQVAHQLHTGFRQGTIDMPALIRKYGSYIASDQMEMVPWEQLTVHQQHELIRTLQVFPNDLRFRFFLDGSGSMTEERIAATKELTVLFFEGLSALEIMFNRHFPQLQQRLAVDTEVVMIGTAPFTAKEFSGANRTPGLERLKRIEAVGHIVAKKNARTGEAQPLWDAADSIDTARERAIAQGKSAELIFEITDGGANELSKYGLQKYNQLPDAERDLLNALVADTKGAVSVLEQRGIPVRAFQIGEPTEAEEIIFARCWGDKGAKISQLSELTPALMATLQAAIQKIKIRLQAQGVDPNVEQN